MCKKLKPGQIENENFVRCRSTNCFFFTKGGCQKCAHCGSMPYELNKSCPACTMCSNKHYFYRWKRNFEEQKARADKRMKEFETNVIGPLKENNNE